MASCSREENERFAAAIAAADPADGASFFPRLAKELQAKGEAVPTVAITFDKLYVQAEASDAAGALPSTANALRALGKVRRLEDAARGRNGASASAPAPHVAALLLARSCVRF